MKTIVDERAIELGEYIVENNTTVRATARKFGISKSTVHSDVSLRLRKASPSLYIEVRKADLPAPVETMPNCCRFTARKRGMAQSKPPSHSFLLVHSL